MPPTALMFVVCQALANQGPLDVNGFPINGVKLDHSTCRNELVQMYDRLAGEGPNLGSGTPRLVCAEGEVPAPGGHLPGRFDV